MNKSHRGYKGGHGELQPWGRWDGEQQGRRHVGHGAATAGARRGAESHGTHAASHRWIRVIGAAACRSKSTSAPCVFFWTKGKSMGKKHKDHMAENGAHLTARYRPDESWSAGRCPYFLIPSLIIRHFKICGDTCCC